MNLISLTRVFLAGVILVVPALGLAQQGAAYPNRPLRMLVTFPPGGSTDLIARMISPPLGERLGRPVIVENRPGASGAIAAEVVAKAPPDGHVLMVAGTSTVMGLNVILIPNLPYDPKDLAPITLLVRSPFIIAINTSMLPVGSIKEMVALLKTKPQQTPFASGGNLTGMHLAGEYFRSLAGLNMLHVPYKGNGPALSDVSGGQVPIAFVDLGSTGPFRKSDRVKILAVADKQRAAVAPDIPTSAEAGLPGWEAIGSFGLVTTTGTPADTIQRLHAEVTRILRLPDIRERILVTGNEPAPMTPDEFGAFAKSEVAKWTRVIKESGIKIEQ